MTPEQVLVTHTPNEGREIWNDVDEDLALQLAQAYGLNVRADAYGAVGDGVTDDAPAFRAAFADAQGDETVRWVYVPAGVYRLASTAGVGRLAATILINTDNVRWTLSPGARIELADGCHGRAVIVRGVTNFTVDGTGAEIRDVRTDAFPQIAFNLENSSEITIHGLKFKDINLHCIAVTEDTSTVLTVSNAFSFDAATHRINAPPGTFTGGALGYLVGGIATVVNSISNNGVYHMTAVDPAGGYITVTENLINESAAAAVDYVKSTGVSFRASDRSIASADGGLFHWTPRSILKVTGSASNNNAGYTVVRVDNNNDRIFVAEAIVDEAAGATVTLGLNAQPSVNPQLALPCNEITVIDCFFEDCKNVALQFFPKARSFNHRIIGNRFKRCGRTTGGAAIKGPQNVINAIISGNQIAHCPTGILTVNWGDLLITGNKFENIYGVGIAITEGLHPKCWADFFKLTIADNDFNYVNDYYSGTLFDPNLPPTYDTSLSLGTGGPMININGLLAVQYPNATVPAWGPIILENNRGSGFEQGLSINKSLTATPNIVWDGNKMKNCGNSIVSPLTRFITLANGSNSAVVKTIDVIVGVPTPGAANTTGLYKGIPLITGSPTEGETVYLLPGTTITGITPATGTVTLSANAVGSGTVGCTTTYPEAMHIEGNLWEDTRTSVVGAYSSAVQIRSFNARILRNTYIGLAPYGLLVKGTGTTVEGNYCERFNGYAGVGGTPTPARSAILLAEYGTYDVINNTIKVGGTNDTGTLDYIVACSAIASNLAGLGGTVKLRTANNTCTLSTVQGQNGGTILPITNSNSGLRTMVDTAAPVSGTWLRAEEVRFNAPVIAGPSKAVSALGGSPGTWRPTAYLVTLYYGSATWDPANLADGARATTTVTVTGAVVGDICSVGFTSITTGNWQLFAAITSANTATVTLVNNTGGAVDLASGTLRVEAKQPY